jgi:hypothetical protein
MPPRAPLLALLGLLALAAIATVACGPSFQVVYEGDARFEHCYAIDDTPTVSLTEKSDCWTDWMRHYTYGQTRNRVDYAAMRSRALQEAHFAPTDEAVMGAAPGGGDPLRAAPIEPVPTNAFATPPKTLSEGDGGTMSTTPAKMVVAPQSAVPGGAPVVAPAGPPAPPAPPHQLCADECRSTWDGCVSGAAAAVKAVCDRKYAGCMKKCF